MPYETTRSHIDPRSLTRVHWHRIDTGDPHGFDGAVGLQTVQHGSGLYLPAGTVPEPCQVRTRQADDESPAHHQCSVHDAQWETGPDEPQPPECPARPEPFDGWCVWHNRDGLNRVIRLMRRARDHAWGPDA